MSIAKRLHAIHGKGPVLPIPAPAAPPVSRLCLARPDPGRPGSVVYVARASDESRIWESPDPAAAILWHGEAEARIWGANLLHRARERDERAAAREASEAARDGRPARPLPSVRADREATLARFTLARIGLIPPRLDAPAPAAPTPPGRRPAAAAPSPAGTPAQAGRLFD